jgi:hypothetical protein
MEMTMAVMTFSNALDALPEVTPVKSAAAEAPGFLSRVFHAMVESRYRAAEREIARHRALMAGPIGAVKVDTNDLPFDHA